MDRARTRLATLAAILLVAGAALAAMLYANEDANPRQPIGLMTSLPIYWSTDQDFGALVSADSAPHWARTALEEKGDLVPLDSLAADGSGDPSVELTGLSRLILAQPRAFAPAEFAALDRWVRAGGHVVIFADPQLTEHSDFALGDPRNPQGVALMSPVFDHWGLRQTLQQGAGRISYEGQILPVDHGGIFMRIPGDNASCEIAAEGYLARCRIGAGHALVWGDAAMLDEEGESAQNEKALDMLLNAAFFEPG